MDVSKEYIEMCGAAKEIQEQWVCKGGDFYSFEGGISTLMTNCVPFKDSIWLPRQGQLQKMLSKEYVDCSAMLQDFCEWISKFDDYLEDLFYGNESMEQLWLLFVMIEQFGKVWNGKSWYGHGKNT